MGHEQWAGIGYYVGSGFPLLERNQEAPASVACDAVRRTGFTQAQLASAFAKVSALWDWKGPIRTEIPVSQQRIVREAIVWFTSTAPDFAAVPGRPDRLLVTARGYRLGPATDAP